MNLETLVAILTKRGYDSYTKLDATASNCFTVAILTKRGYDFYTHINLLNILGLLSQSSLKGAMTLTHKEFLNTLNARVAILTKRGYDSYTISKD